MPRVTCPKCRGTFAVPDGKEREMVLCPLCREAVVPEPGAPEEGASESPSGSDRDILNALFAAANYEERVGTEKEKARVEIQEPAESPPQRLEPAVEEREVLDAIRSAAEYESAAASDEGYKVAGEAQRPSAPAFMPPPLVHRELPSKSAPRHSQVSGRTKGIILLVLIVGVLAASFYFTWRWIRRSDATPPVGTPGDVGAPTSGAPPWTPVMPAPLAQIAAQYVLSPEVIVEIRIIDPAQPEALFTVPASSRLARSTDFGAVTVQDGRGVQTQAAGMPATLRQALAEAIRARLKERGLKASLLEAPPGDGIRLRVGLRLRPLWSVVETPGASMAGVAREDMEVPRAADLILVSADLVAGSAVMDLTGASSASETGPMEFRVATGGAAPEVSLNVVGGATTAVSGSVRHPDLDMLAPAREAGAWLGGLIFSPDRDWQAVWIREQGVGPPVADSFRAIFSAAGSEFVAAALSEQPDRLGPTPRDGLIAVLEDPSTPARWLRPFLKCSREYRDSALHALARLGDAASAEAFRDTLRQSDAPQLLVESSACALLDMGEASPELLDAIRAERVTAFPGVRSPQKLLRLDSSARIRALSWMMGPSASRYQQLVASLSNVSANVAGAPFVIFSTFPALPQDISDLDLVAVCRVIADLEFPPKSDVLFDVAREIFQQKGLGDVLVSPEIPGIPRLPGGAEQRVADVFRAKLIASDPARAGALFAEIVKGPRSWNRLSAIQGILDTDYVDAAPRLRELYKQLQDTPERGPIAMRELEILRPAITHIGRYELKIVALRNFISQKQFDKAQAIVDEIAADKPGSEVARVAAKWLEDAQSVPMNP